MSQVVTVHCEVRTINMERKLTRFARADHASQAREAARLEVLGRINRGELKPYKRPVHVTFQPIQGVRGTDADTANHLPTCKAVLDGCVDAGLIPDDKPEWVRSQTFLPVVRHRNTGISIQFDAIEPDTTL